MRPQPRICFILRRCRGELSPRLAALKLAMRQVGQRRVGFLCTGQRLTAGGKLATETAIGPYFIYSQYGRDVARFKNLVLTTPHAFAADLPFAANAGNAAIGKAAHPNGGQPVARCSLPGRVLCAEKRGELESCWIADG